MKGNSLNENDKVSLVEFISHLHTIVPSDKEFPRNDELKRLNHLHIFEYPYQANNGFNLDAIQSGLQQLSLKYKQSESLKRSVKKLGDIYMAGGKMLVHGDYYPGSWLQTTSGVRIIDPEFSHSGYPEFDIGVMTAHLLMSHASEHQIRGMIKAYRMPEGFSSKLSSQFCGTEIIRRIIGLAQLPLDMTLEEKAALLERAEQFIAPFGEVMF